MIFQHLLLENIFSYRYTEFDLSGSSKERNIVLIYGRNGYGKTSLINAVKLLFVGANEEMRRSVVPNSLLTRDKYILGIDDEWMGIINLHARQNRDANCRIKLVWLEEGISIEAERSWRISKGSQETLKVSIYRGEGEVDYYFEGEEAQEFLNDRLPEDYLPFYFFNSEQIQHLAEANRSKTAREIERILQLSHIDTLNEFLGKVETKWCREEMPGSVKNKLALLEKDRTVFATDIDAKYEKKLSLESERSDLERIIRQEETYLDSKNAGKISVQEGQLNKDSLEKEKNDLESLQLRIVETLPSNAFLFASPLLINNVLKEMDKLLENPTEIQSEALKGILDELPNNLFRSPSSVPSLTENQIRFYRTRLTGLIRAYIPDSTLINDALIQLEDREKAKQLRGLMEHIKNASQERYDRINDLRSVSYHKRELQKIEEKLNDVSTLSSEEQQEYKKRKDLNREREQRIGAINREIEEIQSSIANLERQLTNKDREIGEHEKKVLLSEKNQKRLERTREVKLFFLKYKDKMKSQKRAAVEEAINFRFKQLMTSHSLINRIKIDELFGMHYCDIDGNKIGMASISEGMKQLAATSLLWGLSEVSGKSVPLIIDTPLGRIDLDHQRNLLTHYYPNVSHQVIILPTDSEIDQAKHQLIAPHIYREYCLENPSGADTHVTLLGDDKESRNV